MNKKSLAAIIAATVMAWGTRALADAGSNPHSMTLTMTIGNAMSIHIEDETGADRNDYDFGSMQLGEASVNSGIIKIDNTSGGLLQTYQLSILDTAAGMIHKTGTGALAQDEYRVSALFQLNQPPHASFDVANADADNDIVTAAVKTAEAGAGGNERFVSGTPGAGEDGVSVNDTDTLGEVSLWLRLEAPPAGSTVSGLQSAFATLFVSALNQ
ncbi:MAG: hypothetical protein HY403_04180 [Elusimicrobia bacterium]|nr:hypothetical protein [Elusimicrobiota bacterium]